MFRRFDAATPLRHYYYAAFTVCATMLLLLMLMLLSHAATPMITFAAIACRHLLRAPCRRYFATLFTRAQA